MLHRLAVMLAVSAGVVAACDCEGIPAKEAKRAAEIVFRGTVTAYFHKGEEPWVVFSVDRVWKGNVTSTFKMPGLQEGHGCLGFLPKLNVGAELLVYAHRFDGFTPDYFPLVCNTVLVKDAKDIKDLGPGWTPPKSK